MNYVKRNIKLPRLTRKLSLTFALAGSFVAQSLTTIAGDSPEYFYIEHKPTKHRIESCSALHGSAVKARQSSQSNCAHWQTVPVSGDYFHLKNRETGKLIRPENDQNGSEIEVQPNHWTGNWTQWHYQATDDGFGHIKNRATGKNIFFSLDTPKNVIQQQPSTWSGDYTRWSFLPAPIELPIISARSVALVDQQGDTESIVINETHRLANLLSEDKLEFGPVAAFELSRTISSEHQVFDSVHLKGKRWNRFNLSYSNEETGPRKHGHFIYVETGQSQYLEWEFSQNILTLKLYHQTIVDENGRTTGAGTPHIVEITSIAHSETSVYLKNFPTVNPGAEPVSSISRLTHLHNKLPAVDKSLFNGLTFFASGHTDIDEIEVVHFNENPTERGRATLSSFSFTPGSGSFPDALYRNTSRIGSSAGHFFKENTLVFQRGENNYRFYAITAFDPITQVYDRYGYQINLSNTSTLEQEIKSFQESITSFDLNPGLKNDRIFFSESQMLKVLADNTFIEGGTQGAMQDADGDGILDAEDGSPLDPNESGDFDKDGIADSRDLLPSIDNFKDMDNDGRANQNDNCINIAGPFQENSGCPHFSNVVQSPISELDPVLLSNGISECCGDPFLSEDSGLVVNIVGEGDGIKIPAANIPSGAIGSTILGLNVVRGPESPIGNGSISVLINDVDIGTIKPLNNSRDWQNVIPDAPATFFIELEEPIREEEDISFIADGLLTAGNIAGLNFYSVDTQPILDADNDGILDVNDQFPNIHDFNDDDSDGIPNANDSCISWFGSSEQFGCPTPQQYLELGLLNFIDYAPTLVSNGINECCGDPFYERGTGKVFGLIATGDGITVNAGDIPASAFEATAVGLDVIRGPQLLTDLGEINVLIDGLNVGSITPNINSLDWFSIRTGSFTTFYLTLDIPLTGNEEISFLVNDTGSGYIFTAVRFAAPIQD